MTNKVSFRAIKPEEGPALGALIAANPSTGLMSFSYEYQADVLDVNKATASDLHGLAAVSNAEIIGMVFGDRKQIQLNGDVCEAAYVSNLGVRPDFQRQGIAGGLSDFGLAYAEKILGPDPVLYSAITEGNISTALTKKYRFQSTKVIQGGIVPMRRSAPKAKPGLNVRTASDDDLDDFTDGLNIFYREHNLWSPMTPSDLQAFMEKEVAGMRPNALYVVTRDDRVVGGLSVSNQSSLVRMKLSNTPFVLRMLGASLGILPKDGVLDSLTVRRVWFREGDLEAARSLWQQTRYELRQQGSSLGIAYDPRDKLAEVFQIPFWLPMFNAHYVIKTKKSVELERLTYCVAGP
jgi:GNAT superfamily N-acetyltransferase